MSELTGLGKKALNELITECYRDTRLFCKVFFPGRFSVEFAPLHNEIFEAVDSGDPLVAIAAPRGIGKTSICLALCAKSIVYRDASFIPYVGQSQALAMMHTENLKRSLVTNVELKKVFGAVKATNASSLGIDESFSKQSWVARLDEQHGGTMVIPRGSGQQIRGLLFNDRRPDLIIVDDFEDSKLIKNEELRKEWKKWFFADLMKCISRLEKGWRIIYIDTLKHEDALLQTLLDSPEWTGKRLELCDDSLHSKAPSMVSDEDIRKEFEEYKRLGQLDVFYQENRNLSVAEETKSFKSEYFKYYNEQNLSDILGGSPGRLRNVVIMDPAKTATMQSADSAIVGVGVDREGRSIFVRDIVSGKFYPDQLYREAFEMLRRLNANILAVEVTGLEEFIKQPIKNFGRVSGYNPIYKWLKARRGLAQSGKEERIAALVPYYRAGHIYHNEACCTKLEQQLAGFPRSKLWDVMDCFAYIVEVMELDLQYFEPPDYDDFDDECVFDELENEPMTENWGIV